MDGEWGAASIIVDDDDLGLRVTTGCVAYQGCATLQDVRDSIPVGIHGSAGSHGLCNLEVIRNAVSVLVIAVLEDVWHSIPVSV